MRVKERTPVIATLFLLARVNVTAHQWRAKECVKDRVHNREEGARAQCSCPFLVRLSMSDAAYFAPGVQVHVVRGAVAHAAVNCAVV